MCPVLLDQSIRKMKQLNIYLILIAISFLTSGILEAVYANLDLSFPHVILIAILVFVWCKEHALENNLNSSSGYRLFSAVIPIVGLPVYFFKFFGFKQGGIKTVKTILFSILVVCLYILPFYIKRESEV
jgi:hypothetical protein